jgi:large subunit ribosomal protein L15
MQVNQLKRHTKRATKKTVGRGGKRGTTSGRGTKGQKARTGRKLRPELRDIIKKIPKKRGYRFKSIETKPMTVSTDRLEKLFTSGETVSLAELKARGLVSKLVRTAKVLAGRAKLTKKLTISGLEVSAGARVLIEQAGGTTL